MVEKPKKLVPIESASELGHLPRDKVLDVLRRHDIAVETEGDEVKIIGKGKIDVYDISGPVRKRMVHRLSRLFGIPIQDFYN